MNKDLLVVGIAFSAGGFTPLVDLLTEAICHQNMAFVLVPHLSREHESQMPELLSSITKLKVRKIEEGMKIEPCHLYVLPPGFYAHVRKERLHLIDRPDRGVNLAANILFKSLAETYKKNAIGVVLSGSAVGADGSEGVREIKAHGGHTYAQDPATAEYPDMPHLAILTGSIDLVQAPKHIGHDLTLVSWAS
ncbi:MAG: chemotaxis protein CheB [Bdellovibrionota bacterium]